MAQDRPSGRGPRPLGALLPALTRPAFRRRSPAGAMLLADWPGVVGPGLAAATEPRALAQGTLTIACEGPVALELTHRAPELMARINAHLGRVAVTRLRFVQRPTARPATPPAGPPAALPPRVMTALEGVPGEALRAVLEKLARGVYRGGT